MNKIPANNAVKKRIQTSVRRNVWIWVYRFVILVSIAMLYYAFELAKYIVNAWIVLCVPAFVAILVSKIDPKNKFVYLKARAFLDLAAFIWNCFGLHRGESE